MTDLEQPLVETQVHELDEDSEPSRIQDTTTVQETVPDRSKVPTIEEFTISHEHVISKIQDATKYIQEDQDNGKVRTCILETDNFIKDHLGFINGQSAEVKSHASDFFRHANVYESEKLKFEEKRDALSNDDDFQKMLEKASKKRRSIVRRKTSIKTWNPHTESHGSNPQFEFGDAVDILEKANTDLPRLERDIRAITKSPKRQAPLVQEFLDLIKKTNETLEVNDPSIEKRSTHWRTYIEILNAEVGTEEEIKSSESITEFKKTISEYKEIRNKKAPTVGEEKQTNCICM